MKHRRTRAMITVSFCMKSIHAPILHFREVPVRNEGFVTYTHLVVDDTIQIGSTGYNVVQDCLRNLVNLRLRHIRDRKDEAALWVNSHEPTVLALRGLAIFVRSTGTGWWNSRTLCRDFLMTVHHHLNDLSPLCSRKLVFMPPVLIICQEVVGKRSYSQRLTFVGIFFFTKGFQNQTQKRRQNDVTEC